MENKLKFTEAMSLNVNHFITVTLFMVLIVFLSINYGKALANSSESLESLYYQQTGEMTKPILASFKISDTDEKNSSDKLMVKAWALQFLGYYEEALNIYAGILSVEPDRLAAHYEKVNCLIELKRTTESEAEINAIALKWSKSLEYFVLKYKTDTQVVKTGEESEWTKEIERYRPVSPAETLFKANWYFANGRFDDALDLYRDLQKVFPDNAVPFLREAEILIQKKKYKESILITERIIAKNGNSGAGWRIRGEALAELNKLEESLMSYNKSEELGVESARLYSKRGDLFMKQRSYRDAVTDYSLALEKKPNDYITLLHRAYAYNNLQEQRKAYIDLCNATDFAHDKFPDLYYERGREAYVLGFRQDAIKSFEKFLQLAPDNDPKRAYAIAMLAKLSY